MMMKVYDLPVSLFFTIREYLLIPIYREDVGGGFTAFSTTTNQRESQEKYQGIQSWRNFLNTNKEYLIEIKRETIYYQLSTEVSKEILKLSHANTYAPTFFTNYNRFNQKKLQYFQGLGLKHLPQQVGISLNHYDVLRFYEQLNASETAAANETGEENNHNNHNNNHNNGDNEEQLQDPPVLFWNNPQQLLPANLKPEIPFPFENLVITVSSSRPSSLFGQLPEAEPLQTNQPISLACFPFIKNLRVICSSYRANPSDMVKIELNPETRLVSCVLPRRCKIEQLHCLQSVQMARLLENNVKQPCCFQSLVKLDISNNPEVDDVSPLSHIRYLNLSNCVRIVDVSMLGKVYQLNINGCKEIISIHALSHVGVLSFCGLNHLKDGLSPDNTVLSLTTDDATWILAGGEHFLHHHKKVRICGQSINIFQPVKSRFLPPPNGMKFTRTSLDGYDFSSRYDFDTILQLSLDRCLLPIDFVPTSLVSLKRLSLAHCEGVRTIQFHNFPQLCSLQIDGCSQLHCIEVTKPLQQMIVYSNSFLTCVKVHQPMEELYFKQCHRMEFLDIYADITHLQLVGVKRCKVNNFISR